MHKEHTFYNLCILKSSIMHYAMNTYTTRFFLIVKLDENSELHSTTGTIS